MRTWPGSMVVSGSSRRPSVLKKRASRMVLSLSRAGRSAHDDDRAGAPAEHESAAVGAEGAVPAEGEAAVAAGHGAEVELEHEAAAAHAADGAQAGDTHHQVTGRRLDDLRRELGAAVGEEGPGVEAVVVQHRRRVV